VTTRKPLSKDNYVQAAMEFVDNNGISALTMRALGEKLGVDPTAVYRHFPNKEHLVNAMLDRLLGEALEHIDPAGTPPRRIIVNTTQRVRETFQRHPRLVSEFASSNGAFLNGLTLSKRMIAALQEMGLSGDNLVRCYQMFEGYILGNGIFDSGSAPDTFSIRQARYRLINVPAFDDVARSVDRVQLVAEEAFHSAINLLLDYCESLADK
jgi:AcrR family transcriptional regulator